MPAGLSPKAARPMQFKSAAISAGNFNLSRILWPLNTAGVGGLSFWQTAGLSRSERAGSTRMQPASEKSGGPFEAEHEIHVFYADLRAAFADAVEHAEDDDPPARFVEIGRAHV